jgi:hypothetical protein
MTASTWKMKRRAGYPGAWDGKLHMRHTVLAFLLLVAVFPLHAADTVKASDFHLVSGDGKIAELKDFSNKAFIVFYESPFSEKDNLELKKALIKLKNTQNIGVLAVVDCSSAFMLIKPLWKKALIDKSKEYGNVIYGDWNGKMRVDYELKERASCFMIVDGNSNLIYRHIGRMGKDMIDSVILLLLDQ